LTNIVSILGIELAVFWLMDSASISVLDRPEQDEVININEITQPEQPRRRTALILPALALLVWLIAGSLLTWLLADFNRFLFPAKSPLPPWFIGSLFLGSTLLVVGFYWRSWRSPSTSLENHPSQGPHSDCVPELG